MKKSLKVITVYSIIFIACLTVILPFFWLILTAFKTDAELFSLDFTFFPKEFSFSTFYEIWIKKDFNRYTLNSLYIAVFSTMISVLISSLAAYGFTRYKYRFSKILTGSFLFSQMFPESLLIIPFFLFFSKLSLTNTYTSLIVSYTAFSLPFATWMLIGYFRNIPFELDEAGLIDGCNRYQIFTLIILPVAIPALIATAVFNFLLAWNNFLFAFCLSLTQEMFTLTVGLNSLIGEYSIEWNQLASATIIASVVTIALYSFLQKFFVAGLTSGSVKG